MIFFLSFAEVLNICMVLLKSHPTCIFIAIYVNVSLILVLCTDSGASHLSATMAFWVVYT